MKTEEVKQEPATNNAPLAIIGIGCLFPQADGQNAYWANIQEGLDAIAEIPSTHWQVADYYDKDPKSPDRTYGRRGGFLPPVSFNPMEYNIPPNIMEAIDTSQLLGLVVAGQALKDAGYGPERQYDRNRASVILGVTGTLELVIPLGARLGHPVWRQALQEAGVETAVAEDVVQRISDSYVDWQENSFPGLLGNVVAGRISKHYDLGGTNCVVDAACASSLSALHLAGMELSSGKADMVVTGGIDTFNDIFMYMCFSKTPALSPSGDAKPFDAAADGTILGEGLGIVVLKRLADAERDNDKIYAVIRGVGSSSDGKGDAIYAPSATGQKKALNDAYLRAGVTPESIGLLEAHGTGTKVGDIVEVSALRDVYGEADRPWCALGSVKSQIGHTKAAAGAAGLIKATLALHHKVIPPTAKVQKPMEEVTKGRTPFYLASEKRPWLSEKGAPRRAGVSAFGFGGSNFHVVLEEYRPEKDAVDWDGNTQLLTYSASSAGELATALHQVPANGSWGELRKHAAECRSAFDAGRPCRLAMVVERERTNLPALIANAVAMLKKNPETPWNTPDGVFFATGEKPALLGMLFPGQGSQYTGMLRDMACSFPQMLDTLAVADEGYRAAVGRSISDLIYPHSPFDDATRDAREAELRATEAAQPAIGAVSLGLLKVLRDFGINPAAVAGHSYGELTALCAAGRIDEETLHQLSRLRGKLMGSGEGDKGGMLAVSAPLAAIEQLLAEERLDLVIANRNAPNQAVLSGSSSEIERGAKILAARKLTGKKLPVAAAFHSTLVSAAALPFQESLNSVELRDAELPVFANTTATEYPVDPAAAKELLANQLARPVEFVAEIEAMHAAGVRTFVEVGPGGRLTGLVKAILGDKPHLALAIDASNGKRSGIVDLARALAQLAVLGHRVELAKWDNGFQPPAATAKKPAMTVPLCGANHMKPKVRRPPVQPTTRQTAPVFAPLKQAATPLQESVMQHRPTTHATSIPGEALAESLRITTHSMTILQKMQEETAQLHRRFLEGQEQAGRTFQLLLEQQRLLLGGGVSLTTSHPLHSSPINLAAPPAAAATIPDPQPTVQAVTTPPAAPLPATGQIAQTLLAVVSEKTGYPVEMLELEMGLDSDLGIDSIKRVEILSTIQERLPGAPAIGPEHLGTLRTLGEIANHLGNNSATVAQESIKSHSPATAVSAGQVAQILLSVVSEKTGYPVEMLELEMGLDSDLGIDSIKRVEILSTIQERLPGAPAIGPEHLGTLRTLGEIANHLGNNSATVAQESIKSHSPATAVSAGQVAQILLSVVSEKTGYPVEMLELEMGLDSDLGIDSIKRVEILSTIQERLPGAPAIGPEHLGTLRTLGEIAAHLGSNAIIPSLRPEKNATDTQPPTTVASPSLIGRSGLIPLLLDDSPAVSQLQITSDGEFWLTDDGSPFISELAALLKDRGFAVRVVAFGEKAELVPSGRLAGLVIAAPLTGMTDQIHEDAFLLLKNAAPYLRQAGAAGGALFITVSRLDGAFGCAIDSQLFDPLSGGLAGLAKTAAREWPEVSCKAIDMGGFSEPQAMAETLAAEMFKSGPVEVGLTPGSRTTLGLADLGLPATVSNPPIKPGEVVIITGGGRGVTAAAAVALTEAYRPLLVLLGRSPEPEPEPEWLAQLHNEVQIKRAIIDQAGGKLHPRDIEARYQGVIAGRELKSTLERIAIAGGEAFYRSVDIRDATAVKNLFSDIRRNHGPVRGIIHGAGVLADRLIAEKSREQFALVYSTKVGGLRSLLAATQGDELRLLTLFSSTTGRYGRIGQVAYAVANEVLNKLAQNESRRRPDCRTVSINWGPWDGGMVTPALKKVFTGEGVGLIDLTAGGEFLVREIAANQAPAEIIAIAGSAAATTVSTSSQTSQQLAEAFTLTLTVDGYPFLRSHVLDGKAVLPMAVIVEWLAHGALHGNPGFRFHGFNDLRICKGVAFDQETPCTLHVLAGRAEKRDSFYLVPVELQSIAKEGRTILHARAEIVLASKLPEGIRSIIEIPATPYATRNGELYDRERLFHGPALHGIEQVDGCSEKGIAAHVKSAPTPGSWIKQPLRSIWITDPLVIDSAFQLMILWSFERFGAGSLPCFAGRYRQFLETFPREGVQVVIHVTAERQHSAMADIEFLDRHTGKLVARMEDYECVIDPSLKQAFQRNQLPQPGRVQLGAA